MKLRTTCLVALLALGTLLSAAQGSYYPDGVPEGAAWVELVDSRYIDSGPEAGNWEYIYDYYGGSQTYSIDLRLYFDAPLMVNKYHFFDDNGDGVVDDGDEWYATQNWTAETVGIYRPFGGEWAVPPDRYPSIWEDTNGDLVKDAWVLPTDPAAPNYQWAMENIWHTGDEYGLNTTNFHVWQKGLVNETGLHWTNNNPVHWGSSWMSEGLSNTFRVVHPGEPGLIDYTTYYFNNGETIYSTVVGPVPEPATMSLLAIGACLSLFRRKRR